MLTLRPPTYAHESITQEVDGVTLTLVWHYSRRSLSWRVDVLDGDDVPIRAGAALRPGWNPFYRLKDARMPPGEFWFRAPSEPVGFDDIVNGVAVLVYFDSEEVDALELSAARPTTIIIAEDP